MSEHIIDIEHLTKSFGGNVVLNDLSLSVSRGEVVVLIGPSGCGKSTLLRCINGLEPIQGGSVKLHGEPVEHGRKSLYKVRQKIGMVFQSYDLFPHMTVMKNILLAPMKVQGRNKEDVTREAMALLARVGLEDKADAYPSELSGGQKQRLSIARAIAKHPKIYLFDDSFSALDYKTDVALRRALKAETGDATVIIVAQRISTVLHANQILVLEDGRIVGKGTHAQLMESCPAYQEIARSQLSNKELDLKGGEA